ncbi:hypothetical protein [Amycolatopsis kentuckyensis]|uniref:hypothetical protein n=1 Tax=Amycolatopsis kentuckyensis TaxID=218823 RepID=UPI003365591D
MRGNSGIDQYAILGAGLDSFAHRTPSRRFRCSRSTIRRRRWPNGNYRPPPTSPNRASVTFVPVRSAAEPPRERPVQSGLDPFLPVFASWLGVTTSPRRTAIAAALRKLGGFAPGSEIAADHRPRPHCFPRPRIPRRLTLSPAASALRGRPDGRAAPPG